MANAYEAAARERKVSAVVSQIDHLALQTGIRPYAEAGALADLAESFTEVEWSNLAVMADQKPLSAKSRALVIERLRARVGEQS